MRIALPDDQTINWVTLGVALLFGIISTWLAARQLGLAKRVASFEKTFGRARAELFLVNKSAGDHFIIPLRFQRKRVIQLGLPFEIKSLGERDAEDVVVRITVPNELCFGGASDSYTFDSAMEHIKKIVHSRESGKDATTFILNIPHLAEYEDFVMQVGISLRFPTAFRDSVSAVTKDGVSIDVKYHLVTNFRIGTMCYCRGMRPISKIFSLEIIDVPEAELAAEFDRRSAAALKNLPPQPPWSFWRALRDSFGAASQPARAKRFTIYIPNEAEKIPDPILPIDRFPSQNSKMIEGAFHPADGTYWVPALRTRLFGMELPPEDQRKIDERFGV